MVFMKRKLNAQLTRGNLVVMTARPNKDKLTYCRLKPLDGGFSNE